MFHSNLKKRNVVSLNFLYKFFFLISIVLPGLVLGQQGAGYQLLAPIGNYVQPSVGTDLSAYLDGLFKLGIAIATGLAVIMIVIGGIEYMSTDAISGKSEGRAKIGAALWGLLLALCSYAILNTINSQLLSTQFYIKQATINATPLAIVQDVGTPRGGNSSYVSNGNVPQPGLPTPDSSYVPELTPGGTVDGVRTTYYYAGEPVSDYNTDHYIGAFGEGLPLRYGDINTVGSAAVDTSVYPLGTVFSVQYPDGPHYFVAMDTGGAVQGNHIDFFSTTPVGNGNDYQPVNIISVGNSANFRGLTNGQRETYFNINNYTGGGGGG